MREYRFYVPLENIKGDIVEINGDEHNHLSKVLRLVVGDKITVLCNDGNIRLCIITDVGKKASTAQILETKKEQDTFANVTVFQALIKSDKLDMIVQKCTELGVREFIPFESEFCAVQDKGNKIDRLNRIVLASCKQCGRASSMIVNKTISFKQLVDGLVKYDLVVFAYENEQKSAKEVLSKLSKDSKIAVIVGCEGGFSQTEADMLLQHDVSPVSLGKLILRAETACIALTSVIMYELGEWER